MAGFDISNYNTVPERIVEFNSKHPEGSLQPFDPAKPFEIVEVAGQTYVVVIAAAYRTPDDPRPGVGMAWEPFPGKTPYTRESELQNAETSAWGRAIVAALASDTRKGIASAQEVLARRSEEASRSAHAQRVRALTDLAKQANLGPWITEQSFPWPWSADACDQIEQKLAELSEPM